MLLLLQNRGRMTARQLADELEVSVRTIYRDIDALSVAGVPVYAERGRAGAYQLLGGYRTRLTGMSDEEVRALALSGLPDAATELGLGTVLAAAQLKLHAALPAGLRTRAAELTQRFHVDIPGWHRGIEHVERLAEVADAVWRSRQVRISYRRWDGSGVERDLEPLGLVLKAGNWYLVARCGESDGDSDYDGGSGVYRVYRVSRIDELTDLGAFTRPEPFDLVEFWRDWSRQFERRMYSRIALVRLSPLGRDLVPFFLGSVGVRALREAGREPDEDGWSVVELPVEQGRPALGELLRFGPELQVLEPADLRRELADAVARMGAMYG